MILSAKIPRWWNVTPAQMHWVGLHMRYGRELLAEAALDPELRAQVVASLGTLAAPARTRQVAALLEQGAVKEALDRVTPSELFLLAREVGAAAQCRRVPACWRKSAALADASPKEVNYAAISRAFGTPKPTLANSYEPELLNLRTFPTLMGYSSRIMAESWESNTLLLGGAGRRTQRLAVAAQRADSGVDAQTGGADLRFAPGRLAGGAEIAALRGRRCARARPAHLAAEQKAALQ